jgi:RNA polymerase-binding protein DksA
MRADVKSLKEKRAQTQSEIDRLLEELETSEVDPSEDEADPDVVEREKIVALLDALERRLEEIDAALDQAAAGTYGTCERCGEPIDPERLAIMPEATMCVRCKTIVEKQRAAGVHEDRIQPGEW